MRIAARVRAAAAGTPDAHTPRRTGVVLELRNARHSRLTRPPWFDVAAVVHWCRTAPLAWVDLQSAIPPRRDGSPSTVVVMPDRATGALVKVPVRTFCAEAAALQPDPAGDITTDTMLVDGHLHADYFEKVSGTHDGVEVDSTTGPPIANSRRRATHRPTTRAGRADLRAGAAPEDGQAPDVPLGLQPGMSAAARWGKRLAIRPWIGSPR